MNVSSSDQSYMKVSPFQIAKRLEGTHRTIWPKFSLKLSAILIDDGIDQLDKMVDIEWHKKVVPMVGRILRVERLAERFLTRVQMEQMDTGFIHGDFH
ncbi:hypothetical protein K7X08_023246 [Anisodus acutangulus]|uniref:Uncharacterized protein n=1 Tax=Anisodus acutangulus TaxID=402998 RepID=A0A9Q1LHS7_9SOLA|nr:hypothetical protein K7X08_023246 [Anisodus acutangulus]